MATAAAGVSGKDALASMSAAYRTYALTHPGRYAASVTAPGDEEHARVAAQVLAVITAAFTGYQLDPDSLIHAIRLWRGASHGPPPPETAGGVRPPPHPCV